MTSALGHVEHTAGDALEERIDAFVHGMTRHRCHRAALSRVHGRDRNGLARHRAEHALLAHEGLGRERGALEHLAQVVRRGFGEAGADGRRREKTGITGTARDDDVGPLIQRADERFDAHHRDQPIGAGEDVCREIGASIQSLDADALLQTTPDLVPVHLGADRRQCERWQAMLRCQLADDGRVLSDASIRAGVGSRPDDHRNAKAARRQQHQLQVVALPLLAATVLVGAERLRPDVAAPGVGDDRVGLLRDAEIKAAAFDRREPEVAGRGEQGQAVGHRDQRVDLGECRRGLLDEIRADRGILRDARSPPELEIAAGCACARRLGAMQR